MCNKIFVSFIRAIVIIWQRFTIYVCCAVLNTYDCNQERRRNRDENMFMRLSRFLVTRQLCR